MTRLILALALLGCDYEPLRMAVATPDAGPDAYRRVSCPLVVGDAFVRCDPAELCIAVTSPVPCFSELPGECGGGDCHAWYVVSDCADCPRM